MICTWLPLPSFKDSVQALSDEHLGLQRIHVLEIMEYFHDVEVSQLSSDYQKHDLYEHPVTAMWHGYDLQLIEYGLEACEEWATRKGRRDPFYEKLANHLEWATHEDAIMHKPNWFGDVDFHLSHQAALLKRDRDHYKSYFMADTERALIWPESDYATE